MQDIVVQSFIEALDFFIKRENLSKKDFALKIGWTPSELGNVLKRRTAFGAKRQKDLIQKLGSEFEAKVSEILNEKISKDSGAVAEEGYPHYGNLSDEEQEYIQKVIDILRGKDKQSKFALKTNIDTFHRTHREARDIEKDYTEDIKGGKEPEIIKKKEPTPKMIKHQVDDQDVDNQARMAG